MTEQEVKDYICDMGYEDTIVIDGEAYADAFIGITSNGIAIYDYEMMVEGLMKHDGMTEEEAMEWIDYNIIGAYIANGPTIVNIGNEAYERKVKESNVIVGNFKKADKTEKEVA